VKKLKGRENGHRKLVYLLISVPLPCTALAQVASNKDTNSLLSSQPRIVGLTKVIRLFVFYIRNAAAIPA
jgi:hypothetical protein